jgi:hypothetical protein
MYALCRECNAVKITNKPFIGVEQEECTEWYFWHKNSAVIIYIYIFFLYILVGVCHGTILQPPAAINGYLLSTGCAVSSW